MSHQVFVPVTDDLIYNHPELIEGPLVPYFAGMECQNWLSIEINPDDDKVPETIRSDSKTEKKTARKPPKLRLAYSV